MKRTWIIATTFALATASFALAQQPPTTGTAPRPTAGCTGPGFVDANGDGICDNKPATGGQQQGRGYGPGNGTGNRGIGPKDGTGYGPGTGICNGTGTCTGAAQGQQARGRGRRPRG